MDNDRKSLKAIDFCYRLLRFRLRTEKELTEYLRKKKEKHNFSEDMIKRVIDDLKEQNFINDQEFVEWFVRSRISRKQKSEWVLKQELLKHGIPKEFVDRYFLDNPVNDLELGMKALASKWPKWEKLPQISRFKKIYGYLRQKGFSYEIIKKTVAIYEKKD